MDLKTNNNKTIKKDFSCKTASVMSRFQVKRWNLSIHFAEWDESVPLNNVRCCVTFTSLTWQIKPTTSFSTVKGVGVLFIRHSATSPLFVVIVAREECWNGSRSELPLSQREPDSMDLWGVKDRMGSPQEKRYSLFININMFIINMLGKKQGGGGWCSILFAWEFLSS